MDNMSVWRDEKEGSVGKEIWVGFYKDIIK